MAEFDGDLQRAPVAGPDPGARIELRPLREVLFVEQVVHSRAKPRSSVTTAPSTGRPPASTSRPSISPQDTVDCACVVHGTIAAIRIAPRARPPYPPVPSSHR